LALSPTFSESAGLIPHVGAPHRPAVSSHFLLRSPRLPLTVASFCRELDTGPCSDQIFVLPAVRTSHIWSRVLYFSWIQHLTGDLQIVRLICGIPQFYVLIICAFPSGSGNPLLLPPPLRGTWPLQSRYWRPFHSYPSSVGPPRTPSAVRLDSLVQAGPPLLPPSAQLPQQRCSRSSFIRRSLDDKVRSLSGQYCYPSVLRTPPPILISSLPRLVGRSQHAQRCVGFGRTVCL